MSLHKNRMLLIAMGMELSSVIMTSDGSYIYQKDGTVIKGKPHFFFENGQWHVALVLTGLFHSTGQAVARNAAAIMHSKELNGVKK